MDFSAYRLAVRQRALELATIFPSGYVTVVSDANAVKGSVAGIKTDCNLTTAAKHEIDGTGHVLMPEPETAEVQS